MKHTINSIKNNVLNFFKRINKPDSTNHFDIYGIYHDQPYVKNCLNRCDRLFRSTIESLKQDFLFGDNFTTLCYLSSGTEDIYNRFSQFDGINNIILIDYQFKEYNCIRVSDNQRIYCIPSEVVAGSSILKNAGVSSINYLVDINSGMDLGFGFYTVSSNLSLSTYTPLLNSEKVTFIGSKKYLKSNKQYSVAKNYLNCFQYQSRKLLKSDEYADNGLMFDLSLLTTYQHSCQDFDVTVFEHRVTHPTRHLIQKRNLNIHFIQENIFEYNVDVMMMYFRNTFQYSQFNKTFNNVLDFRGTYFNQLNSELYTMSTADDIIRLSDSGIKSIGFVPLKGYDYVDLINRLANQRSRLTDLYFFYFDTKDLNEIYKFNELE